MAIDNSKLNVVAVGASAGGVEALKDFGSGLRRPSTHTIRVAMPNRHLLVDGNRIALSQDSTENGGAGVERSAVRGLSERSGRR
jgi:two-component system chemotaxis response regulator CheB